MAPFVWVDSIEEGQVVIDVRAQKEFDKWHYPGAIRKNTMELENQFSSLDKTKTYVIVCEVGVESSAIAEQMQTAGYQAYSLKGGAQKLKSQHS